MIHSTLPDWVLQQPYIFVLGHIRSNSSLLCHILGSHDEISGYFEAQQSYYGWLDLYALRKKVFTAYDSKTLRRYVLDKVLHGYHYISHNILSRANVKVIYILRRDYIRTIKSIVKMERSMWNGKDEAGWAALFSYRLGLSGMQRCLLHTKANSFFLESEQILECQDRLLHRLSEWLGLKSTLSKEYEIFAHTGEKGFGDPTASIFQGKVAKGLNDYSDVRLDKKVEQKAGIEYTACLKNIVEHVGEVFE